MYEIGISTFKNAVTGEYLAALSENEIKHIEISQDNYDDFDFIGVKRLAKEHGVNIWSLHLPFTPFEILDLSSEDRDKRRFSVEKLSELIKRAGDTGIDKFVVHPSVEPISDDERGDRLKYSRESLSFLADAAENFGGIVCTEDLPRTCIGHSIEEMQFLTAEDDRLRICFDTNHITVQKPEEAIIALGSKIVTLHVSDFDFVNERHWLPGEGEIDWAKVIAALEEINYGGVWMYEIGFKCPKTILRDRSLIPSDFKRNSEEILKGLKPTVFSKQKPNLGMWE